MSAIGKVGAPTFAERAKSDELSKTYMKLSDEGHTYPEIALMFDTAERNVGRRVRRARAGCSWDKKPRSKQDA